MAGTTAKGYEFEDGVEGILKMLAAKYPERARYRKNPKLRLLDGQHVYPDFEFEYELPHKRDRYLVECQDRKRTSRDIVNKIRAIKGLSSKNKFIFVHANSLAQATMEALASDGVMVMTRDEFSIFVSMIMHTLAALAQDDDDDDYGQFICERVHL